MEVSTDLWLGGKSLKKLLQYFRKLIMEAHLVSLSWSAGDHAVASEDHLGSLAC